MKAWYIVLIVSMAILIAPLSAADENATLNQTVPVILTFSGGHPWGENPVQIIESSTGGIVHITNTSGRNITVEPDRDYILRVEPAGLVDAAHSPDSILIGLSEYAGKNPLGSVFICLIVGAFISAYRRKVTGVS
jgi:hypothetical protein